MLNTIHFKTPFTNNVKTHLPFTAKRELVDLFKYDDFIRPLPRENDPDNEILKIINTLYKRLKNNTPLEISDCLKCLHTLNHSSEIIFSKKVQLDKNTYVLIGMNNNIKTWDDDGKDITVSEAYIKTVNTRLNETPCSDIYITSQMMPAPTLKIFGREISFYQDAQTKLLTLAEAICKNKN